MCNFPKCQVCHQHFSLTGPSPFLLPCLHSVCETCVTSVVGGVISCSTCLIDVEKTRLQKDVILEKRILHMKVKQHPELVLCTYEEDGNQAVCWCRECEDFLCEHCQMIHGRPKISRHHVVEEIGDLKPGSFDVDTYCTIHPKYLLDTWDEECCVLICRICQDGEHVDHKSVVFDKAVENAKIEVAGFEKELQSSLGQTGTHLTTIVRDIQASDETCNNLSRRISHTFNTLKSLIDQREKELQIELQQHQEKIKRELNEKKNTSEGCQKKCQATYDYISKTLQYSSRHDIMSLKHILQSKTRECISSARATVYETPPLPRFNTDGLEKIKSVLAGFGRMAWTDDPTEETQTKDCETQTEDWVSGLGECEELKQKLLQLKTTHDEEIQLLKETLTEVKEEEKKGIYRLKTGVSDAAYLLNCTRVEFSRTKYNTNYVYIKPEGELIRKESAKPPQSNRRLKNYRGTSTTVPLSQCECPQYFEVKTKLGIEKALDGGMFLLEIVLTNEEEQDESLWRTGCPQSYSLTVSHCTRHSSICRRVLRHDKTLRCLPDTLDNTPGTSATLHVGVVHDSVRGRIAFLDVKNEKIIGKIDNVDSLVSLWPMFGLYNPDWATISMSIIDRSDISMTESKKELLLQSLS